jgi:hypothetical protein
MKKLILALCLFVSVAEAQPVSVYQPPTPVAKMNPASTPGATAQGIAVDEFLNQYVRIFGGGNVDASAAANQFHRANTTPIADGTPVVLMTPIPTPTGTPASTYYHITSWTVANSHATVDTNVQLLCGAVIKDVCPAAHAGGGCVDRTGTEIRCAASDSVSCKSVTDGSAITCTVHGYFSAN